MNITREFRAVKRVDKFRKVFRITKKRGFYPMKLIIIYKKNNFDD